MESAFLSRARSGDAMRCGQIGRRTEAKKEVKSSGSGGEPFPLSPFLFLTSSSFGIAPPLFIMLTNHERRR